MKVDLTPSPFLSPALPQAVTLQPGSAASGFAGALQSAIDGVETAQQSAQAAAMDFLANGKGDVHNVALAAQRAELTLELFQQVRNKFVQAYQEIMKTPM
jgi:flagellar hook-basal body complex protein FliE